MYDHTITPRLEFTNSSAFKFFGIGISGHNKPEKNLLSLKTMIKFNNDFKTRKILKIDVEGAEWETFDQMDLDTLLSFEQIVGEFHWYFLKLKED